MKSVAELRRERNETTPVNKDSLYKVDPPPPPLQGAYVGKPIERVAPVFRTLKIPKTLQSAY
jgi:hypothetical protein